MAAVDERGLATAEESGLTLPLSRLLFTRRHAKIVRDAVEDAVDAIVGAMQPEYRAWAEKWQTSQAIPAILVADEWRPKG